VLKRDDHFATKQSGLTGSSSRVRKGSMTLKPDYDNGRIPKHLKKRTTCNPLNGNLSRHW
jgi:hypothetical protein